MRTALVLRHVGYEGLGALARPITAARYAIRSIDVPETSLDEDVLAADLVVAMGGPMSVYERAEHPWLAPEIDLIAKRIARGRATLGICLGSQLIAAALGAPVYAGPVKEVGFAPVTLSAAGQASPLRHLAGVPILHWHGDTFDLPPGTTLLASTDRYTNQAFASGDHVLALQCHPEMGTDADFPRWLEGADAYVAAAETTPERLVADYAALGPAAAHAGVLMMAEWLADLTK